MIDEKEFLPLGSIVTLAGADNYKFIICGYAAVNLEKDTPKLYDYCAYQYPAGMIKNNQILLFCKEKITSVIFKGYTDDEVEKHLEQLKIKLADKDFVNTAISSVSKKENKDGK